MSAGHDTALCVIRDAGALSRGQAEAWLHERLAGWPAHDVLRVELVIAELLDNAQRHGEPHYVVELVLDRRSGCLTIRVRNRPAAGATSWDAAAGLLIVEVLGDQWGVVPLEANTTVWVEVRFDR